MAQVRRSLLLHAPLRRSPRHVLRTLLDRMSADASADDPVDELEQRIRTLLGTEAAMFFPAMDFTPEELAGLVRRLVAAADGSAT